MFRAIFRYFATLPARWRAARLGFAFTSCPVCGRPFSAEEIMHTPGGPACLMSSPSSGMTVCKDCQDEARRRNRARWGRDMSDPWPAGAAIIVGNPGVGGRTLTMNGARIRPGEVCGFEVEILP